MFLFVLAQGTKQITTQATSQIATKHYESGEISFDYPASWQQLKAGNSQIAVFKDPYSGYNITINRQVIPNPKNIEASISYPVYKPNTNYIINIPEGVQNDFKPVSTETGNISGVPFTLNTYKTKINNTPVTIKELWLQKNNALYSVIYKSLSESSGNIPFLGKYYNPREFDVIKNSLKVNDSKLNQSAIFASISIPRLGVTWDVRTDTVNAYNGVYHYGESYYPGQSGSFGVLGHHTTLSAPFNHIETLKSGDKVYIDDYLTQKRYVYHVYKTDDIRYDYNTNRIKFYAESRELIVATCWPPGSTAAEIYIHCQLDSVEPI